MKNKKFFTAAAICLALLLFACEVKTAGTTDNKRADATSPLPDLEMWPLVEKHASSEIGFSWEALPQGYTLDVFRLEEPLDMNNAAQIIEKAGSVGYSYPYVESGKTYYYHFRLNKIATGQSSPLSKLYSITIPQPEMKTIPANLKVVNIEKNAYVDREYNVDISWSPVTGADEYLIYTDYFIKGRFMLELERPTATSTRFYARKSQNSSFTVKVKAIRHSPKGATAFSDPITVTFPN